MATIQQLGYPTKNALRSWHREFERSRDLPAGHVRASKYSGEQKQLAVDHYLDHGHCMTVSIEIDSRHASTRRLCHSITAAR